MAQLLNEAEAAGIYAGVGTDHATDLFVELAALKVTKTADKPVWVSGDLKYTVVIENTDKRNPDDPDEPGLPVSSITASDKIDTKIVALIDGSIEIDGNPAQAGDYSYDPLTGVISFLTLADLPAGSSHIITFRVEKAQP